MKNAIVRLAVGVLALVITANADVVTFSGLVNNSIQYTEAGMGFFVAPGVLLHTGTLHGPALHITGFVGIALVGGGSFNLNSLDLCNGYAGFTSYRGATPVGFLGATTACGFTDVSSDPNWQNITSIGVDPNGFQFGGDALIDDLNFTSNPTAAPEPGSLILLGSGLLGLAGTARKSKFFGC